MIQIITSNHLRRIVQNSKEIIIKDNLLQVSFQNLSELKALLEIVIALSQLVSTGGNQWYVIRQSQQKYSAEYSCVLHMSPRGYSSSHAICLLSSLYSQH